MKVWIYYALNICAVTQKLLDELSSKLDKNNDSEFIIAICTADDQSTIHRVLNPLKIPVNLKIVFPFSELLGQSLFTKHLIKTSFNSNGSGFKYCNFPVSNKSTVLISTKKVNVVPHTLQHDFKKPEHKVSKLTLFDGQIKVIESSYDFITEFTPIGNIFCQTNLHPTTKLPITRTFYNGLNQVAAIVNFCTFMSHHTTEITLLTHGKANSFCELNSIFDIWFHQFKLINANKTIMFAPIY